MGRPHKQTVDYFPHFVSTDSKTKFILEQEWGNDGYAFWFKLLELLGRSEGHFYDCSITANRIYMQSLMKIDEATVEKILGTLSDLGNIDKELWEQQRIIWCQSLVDNLKDVYAKRTVSIPTRPTTARATPTETEPEAEQEPDPEAEPKEEPKRTRSKRTSCLTVKQMELFERFYSIYPKKADRGIAEKAWHKLDPDEAMTEQIVQAVENAKKYDSRFRERQFTPNPASWLNAKGYLNEYSQEDSSYGGYGKPDGAGTFRPSAGFKTGE